MTLYSLDTTRDTMADKDADFLNYVDSVKRKETLKENEALAAQLRQEWRETTWAGGLILLVEKAGLANFFLSIGESFEGGQDTTSFYLSSLIYRIGTIVASILFVYAMGRIFNAVVGEEIVINQEIVIVEEVTRAQVEEEERLAREKLNGDENKGDKDEVVPTNKSDGTTKTRRRGKRS